MIVLKLLYEGDNTPPTYQEIICHIYFYIKMGYFWRKDRYFEGGHATVAPPTFPYASVVSRESVRVALTLAALNDPEDKTSDIQNAYLTAPCLEKICTTLGSEFGPDLAGKKALVVRVLYGITSAGASFKNHLSECTRNIGYPLCPEDPDLWFKEETCPSDGDKHYAYFFLYVDNCLVIHNAEDTALHELDHFFTMKSGSIGYPNMYLGAKLRKVVLENGFEAWATSALKYLKEAVSNSEDYLHENFGGRKFSKKVINTFESEYDPLMNSSADLGLMLMNYYQTLIGVLRGIVELGRIDIITEVSMLVSQLALQQYGHPEAVFYIFGYQEGPSQCPDGIKSDISNS